MLIYTTYQMMVILIPLAVLAAWTLARTIRYYREHKRFVDNYKPAYHGEHYLERCRRKFDQYYCACAYTCLTWCMFAGISIITYFGAVHGAR
ncbi:hypothetical protein [Pseudomonas phage D6]|nr:hypothetical protein [Pseudomonas phage D6]